MNIDGNTRYKLGWGQSCLSPMDKWHKYVDESQPRTKGLVTRAKWIAKTPDAPKPKIVQTLETISQLRANGQISERQYIQLVRKCGF